ncbi:hypothetical protein ACLOJK_034511 [Asimina triloba]
MAHGITMGCQCLVADRRWVAVHRRRMTLSAGWICLWDWASARGRLMDCWLMMAERGDELLQASDGQTADDGFGLLPALEELLAQGAVDGGGARRLDRASRGRTALLAWAEGAVVGGMVLSACVGRRRRWAMILPFLGL